MRNQIALVLVSAVLALPLGAEEKAKPKPPSIQPVQIVKAQWQYKVEVDINEHRMNELGGQGWELVGFQQMSGRNSSTKTTYIFKRPRVGE